MNMIGVAIAVVGITLTVAIAAFGGALGQARAAAAALEGLARQPEAAGDIRTMLIIALAFIESLVIYALLTFFLLQGPVAAALQKIAAGGG